MIIRDKVIFITGANGGIGKCLVNEFLKRGAAKIYAADLIIGDLSCNDKVFPIRLNITHIAAIESCKQLYTDVDILINNAGIELAASICNQPAYRAKLEMDVNCLGLHGLSVALWDTLKSKDDAAIINILSIASFVHIPEIATYCASKAAAHSITQGFRYESINTSIKVVGVYPGYVDTNMTKNIDVVKVTPEELVFNICDDFEHGIIDIFPDSMSKELSKSWNQNSIYIAN